VVEVLVRRRKTARWRRDRAVNTPSCREGNRGVLNKRRPPMRAQTPGKTRPVAAPISNHIP
jgi:hypothetical protein